jgi:hypothetical protein
MIVSAGTGPVDHAFDGSFSGAHDNLAGLVADGHSMRVRAVFDLPDHASSHADAAPPVVDVPDGTAAIVAEITGYGS